MKKNCFGNIFCKETWCANADPKNNAFNYIHLFNILIGLQYVKNLNL